MLVNRGRLAKRRERSREELSPMESMVNLVDVMLVFICGLLISIIIFWNLDVSNLVNISTNHELVLIEDPETIEEQMGAISQYEDRGAAVLDPNTGDVYVVEEVDE